MALFVDSAISLVLTHFLDKNDVFSSIKKQLLKLPFVLSPNSTLREHFGEGQAGDRIATLLASGVEFDVIEPLFDKYINQESRGLITTVVELPLGDRSNFGTGQALDSQWNELLNIIRPWIGDKEVEFNDEGITLVAPDYSTGGLSLEYDYEFDEELIEIIFDAEAVSVSAFPDRKNEGRVSLLKDLAAM